MNMPEKNLDTPFNITRSSHVVLTVKDLEKSRLFYTEVVGLVVTEQAGDTLYLRGVEEACHHSLVLKQSKDAPRCERIGMRVLRETRPRAAEGVLRRQGPEDRPGRTCRTRASRCTSRTYPACRWNSASSMTVVPRPLTQFHLHKGGSALRLDHYQILVPGRAQGLRVLHGGGLLADRIPLARQQRRVRRRVPARKGNPHDIVFFKEKGPRLHHAAFTAPESSRHHARLRLRRRARLRQGRRARTRTARAGARALCLSARSRRPSGRDLQHPLPGDGPRSAAGALGPGRPDEASIRGACRRSGNGTRRRRRSRAST